LALASQHGLAGFLHRRVERLPEGSLPDAAAVRIETAWRRQKFRTLSHLHLYRSLLSAFASESIPCIVLKGVDLAQRIYPDSGLRPFQDLDLLIRESDLNSARGILARAGYRKLPSQLPSYLMRQYHFHLPFYHRPSGTLVELHWALADQRFALRFEDVDDRSKPTDAGYRVLPPMLYAAYLMAHADRHGVVNPWTTHHPRVDELMCHPHSGNRLIWYVDLALLLRDIPSACAELADAATELGAEAPVRRMCFLLHRRFGGSVLSDRSPEPPPQPAKTLGARLPRKLIDQMLRDLDGRQALDLPAPRLWRTDKRFHLRPVRLLFRERSVAPPV
jgi:hypothetical protein